MNPRNELKGLGLLAILLLVGSGYNPAVAAQDTNSTDGSMPWLSTKERLTLLSANDGQNHLVLDGSHMMANLPMRLERTNLTKDSISVVHLGPDHPPIVKTVYGIAPNTISGAPYLAMSRDGHYGFVPCSNGGVFVAEQGQLLSMIDLTAAQPLVVQTIRIPSPMMASMHPDGKHLIIACATGFQVFELRDGKLVLEKDNQIGVVPDSMDVSPNGDYIVAALSRAPETHDVTGIHLFS